MCPEGPTLGPDWAVQMEKEMTMAIARHTLTQESKWISLFFIQICPQTLVSQSHASFNIA
jgi:hypothetical protein